MKHLLIILAINVALISNSAAQSSGGRALAPSSEEVQRTQSQQIVDLQRRVVELERQIAALKEKH